MTICRKCGTSNQDGKKFCVFCNELLVADPVEMAKREVIAQKKREKLQKKLDAKHKRWKKALYMLIPIGILDLINLFLCLDLALIGIGSALGRWIGDIFEGYLGRVISLFGNDVYTSQVAEYVLRGCELLLAFAILLAAGVLSVIMIVRLIKWRVYLKKGDQKEQALVRASAHAQARPTQEPAQGTVEQAAAEEIKVAMGEMQVSYAALAQIDAQKQAYEMPEPLGETDCRSLFESVAPMLWEYDEDSVRRILSAMAASRFLLCSAGAMDRAGLFAALTRAFGVSAEPYTYPTEQDEPAGAGMTRVLLQRDGEAGVLTHTPFAKALYTAGFSPKNICLAGIEGLPAAQTQAILSPMHAYFSLPAGNVALYLGQSSPAQEALPARVEEGMLVLSPNLWVLSILPEQDRVPVVGKESGAYGAAVYLRNSGKAFPPEESQAAAAALPSVEALERAVAAAENEYYLSEELWQVLDRMEQLVLEAGGCRISNRTLRMLERYTAAYLAMGGKQSEAFDNGFAAILLPAYEQQLRLLAERESGETLTALLERTVGKESLPVTLEVLTLMGLA